MSRNLPAQPNLEHLKNQAKVHLDELRTTNPAAQLADALHAIAKAWDGPRAFETTASQNRAVVGRGRYEVSEDGGSLVITSERQRIVCSRG